jgi:hypothetical protein
LAGEKVIWVNLLAISNAIWSFMIRSEQKEMIKKEIEKMFEVISPGTLIANQVNQHEAV